MYMYNYSTCNFYMQVAVTINHDSFLRFFVDAQKDVNYSVGNLDCKLISPSIHSVEMIYHTIINHKRNNN